MAVVDVDEMARRAVVVYNTEVTASGNIATRYAAKRGIPAGNLVGVAMGTDAYLMPYSATAFADFYEPIYDKVVSVGARAVLVAAGSPNYIGCVEQGDGATTSRLPIANTLSLIKRIGADGNAPRSTIDVTGVIQPYMGSSNVLAFPPSDKKAITIRAAGYCATSQPAAYLSAITDAGFTAFQSSYVTDPTGGLRRDYSKLDYLPCGIVGRMFRYTGTASHPANLEDDSLALIEALQGATVDLATARGKQVVVAIRSITNNAGDSPAARFAVLVKELTDAGFTNVEYFYSNSSTDPACLTLAPSPTRVVADVNAGSVSVNDVWLAIGSGFENNYWNPANATTWRPSSVPHFAPATDGLIMAGLSDHDAWCRYWIEDGGAGGVGRFSHPNSTIGGAHWERLRSLLRGETLAEAVFWQPFDFDHVAIGDPLHNPIRV